LYSLKNKCSTIFLRFQNYPTKRIKVIWIDKLSFQTERGSVLNLRILSKIIISFQPSTSSSFDWRYLNNLSINHVSSSFHFFPIRFYFHLLPKAPFTKLPNFQFVFVLFHLSPILKENFSGMRGLLKLSQLNEPRDKVKAKMFIFESLWDH